MVSRALILSIILLAPWFIYAQTELIVKLPDLQKAIEAPSTKEIKVFNFWATWCAPCIKELPYFEKVNREQNSVDVVLVSLDLDLDPNPEKVFRFIERKKIQSKVMILNERDPNSWINKIDKEWSGALPATIIINTKTGKRKFVEGQLEEGELERLIDQMR